MGTRWFGVTLEHEMKQCNVSAYQVMEATQRPLYEVYDILSGRRLPDEEFVRDLLKIQHLERCKNHLYESWLDAMTADDMES